MSLPEITVIVPTFNDAENLLLCLEALQNQTLPDEKYEVIVIDNGSDEVNLKILRNNGISFLTENHLKGSYAARNKGIRAARGKILAFTDSDCKPAADWLERSVEKLLAIKDKALVGGRIELFFKNPDKPTAVELYESLFAFNQKHYVENLHFSATANMVTFRNLFDEIGLFDDRLFSSGDYEWGRKLFSKGYQLLYVDNAVVYHPARYSFIQLRNKIKRIAGGRYGLSLKHGRGRYWIDAMRRLMPPVRRSVKILFFEQRLSGLSARFRVVCVLFFVRYVQAYEKLKLALGADSVR
ncbi:MAG TPA: glycosyltransferase [Gammaproteobacteria bacterium]